MLSYRIYAIVQKCAPNPWFLHVFPSTCSPTEGGGGRGIKGRGGKGRRRGGRGVGIEGKGGRRRGGGAIEGRGGGIEGRGRKEEEDALTNGSERFTKQSLIGSLIGRF